MVSGCSISTSNWRRRGQVTTSAEIQKISLSRQNISRLAGPRRWIRLWSNGRDVTLEAKPLDTIVGCGTHLEGVMKVENNARIDGVFKGELSCRGRLTISLSGAVQADLEGTVVVVRGTVHGTLCADKVHLDSQARFFGDIHTRTLSVAEGALFHGSSLRLDDRVPERQIVDESGPLPTMVPESVIHNES